MRDRSTWTIQMSADDVSARALGRDATGDVLSGTFWSKMGSEWDEAGLAGGADISARRPSRTSYYKVVPDTFTRTTFRDNTWFW